MRIAPVGPISSVLQALALAAVEGALADNTTLLAATAGAPSTSPDAPQAPAVRQAPPPPADPARAAVDQAKASAAAAQTSLAPMFADIAAVLNAPTTPPQLRTALANVLALRTPIGATFSGPQLQQAVAQSGVMLEAKLAAGLAPGRDLKAALLNLASTLQSLPLQPAAAMTGAPRPLAQHAGMLTPDAQAVEVPRAGIPAADGDPLPAEPLLPAPRRDGGAISQRPQDSNPPVPRAGGVAPPTPTEGVSQRVDTRPSPPIREGASSPPRAGEAPPRPAAEAERPQLQTRPTPPVRDGAVSPHRADAYSPLAARAGEGASRLAAEVGPHRTEARPPPPVRDGALNPQRAEVSSLPAARAGEVAPRLIADVEHAVARQVLHQIASLPQGPDGPAWMFELPFLTPQGAMLAQFAIHRDDAGQGAAHKGGPTWRARFAMEIDPLGPVHVDLRMGGGQRSHVTLWAGEAVLERMAPESDLLGRALDADVSLRPGAPNEGAPATPGQFVNRRS